MSGTSGCNDVDGSNVRVNQECTNQSDAAFLGRGQGQNETAAATSGSWCRPARAPTST